MRLQQELQLPQASLVGVTLKPGEESDPWTVVTVRAALTRDVAEAYGCRELIFAGDVPRSGVKQLSLEGSEIDCTVHFAHEDLAFTIVAHRMGKYTALMEGTGPQLKFQLAFKGYGVTLAEMVEKSNGDPVEITLKPAQMDLSLQPEAEQEVVESVVDEGERPISPEQAADTAAENDGPALAPAALVGGTHQRRGRRRQPEVDPILSGEPGSEEETDFIKEVMGA